MIQLFVVIALTGSFLKNTHSKNAHRQEEEGILHPHGRELCPYSLKKLWQRLIVINKSSKIQND